MTISKEDIVWGFEGCAVQVPSEHTWYVVIAEEQPTTVRTCMSEVVQQVLGKRLDIDWTIAIATGDDYEELLEHVMSRRNTFPFEGKKFVVIDLVKAVQCV